MAGDIYESDGEETPVARWIVRFSRMVISSVATDLLSFSSRGRAVSPVDFRIR